MAELAAAGSVVGLISLSIQACQGLTSYYSAWTSYDEEIRQTYRDLDELKIICQNLERELQRIARDHEPAVQQVFRLIVSCQDGIKSLDHALDRCRSSRVPDSIATSFGLHRARALYPFRKQTLQTHQNNVRGIQGNLAIALQILQLHLWAEHEQRLSSLASIASGTETAIHSNQTAIQALSSPLQAISQAFPLIQQQTENTAIVVRAARDESHGSRLDTQNFRDMVLQELTKLANSVENSPRSLEATIAMALNQHSVRFHQLQQEMQSAHSRGTGELLAKMQAMDQTIKALQLGIISKPGLMQSVCEEEYRSNNLPGSDTARRDGWLQLRDSRMKTSQLCSCKPKRNGQAPETLSKSSYFEFTSNPKRKFIFETESISHLPTCNLFPKSARTTVAKFRIRSCGALLAGAIEASISIARGAGGLSIGSDLQCARVVPHDSLAFRLVQIYPRKMAMQTSIIQAEAIIYRRIHKLERLFSAGKASPYDVDPDGRTLLHEASRYWFLSRLWVLDGPKAEVVARLLKRLQELCVPLNWTNDENCTLMNTLLLGFPHKQNPGLPTLIKRLLETGAEFGKFSPRDRIENIYEHGKHLLGTTTSLGDCAELVDALEHNQVSIAILHRSEGELLEALRDWPQSVNEANKIGYKPLHSAVGWPFGVRALLQHGACVDSTDHSHWTPLFYAIYQGCSDTVTLLMKANCILTVNGVHAINALSVASGYLDYSPNYQPVSQVIRVDVLDTVIALLAERRRDLQSRLVDLPTAAKTNTAVFQDDRILDEYAEYAERVERNALREYGHTPVRASTLLGSCRTVYHIEDLTVAVAEKLWQTGFRDIDVPDKYDKTPLTILRWSKELEFVAELELCSWLVQKGAELHRPAGGPIDYDPDRALDSTKLPPETRALHFVAAKIGDILGWVMYDKKITWLQQHHYLGARLLLATDVAYDDCICACSSQGCLASTMMLKSFCQSISWSPSTSYTLKSNLLAIQFLINSVDTYNSCWSWLAKEVIRCCTFQKLELRHTCCRWDIGQGIMKLEPEEVAEIRDEDHEKIELLESLLQEFEEHRHDQDLLSFFEGYWATKMEQVLQEQCGIDEEGLRRLGVVLHQEENDGGGPRLTKVEYMEESDSDDSEFGTT